MATREELEAAIDAHPDEVDNYLVLADWLQERIDPRGELITLYDRPGDAAAERRAALERELTPPRPRTGSQQWFRGFIRELRWTVDAGNAELIRRALAHPSLRHLVEADFALAGDPDDDRQWLIDAIAEQPRPCWRSLEIDSYARGGELPSVGSLDLTALWDALPRVGHVRIAASEIVVGDLRATALRELDLAGEVANDQLAAIVGGNAPDLAVLRLHDLDVGAFARILEATAVTLPLTRLLLPQADASIQDRIRARYPCAAFSARAPAARKQVGDGDA